MTNRLLRHSLYMSMSAALLAGCGVSQPPVGTPGAVQQSRSLAFAQTEGRRRQPSSSYAVLWRFGGSPRGPAHPLAGLIDLNGTLYGTTFGGGSSANGTVYAISSTGAKRVLYRFQGGTDGASPRAGLVSMDNKLYGTTFAGGGSGCHQHGCGTVYSINTAGVETVVYRFTGGSDGESPFAGLLPVNGTLYGTTTYGGGSGCRYSEGCGTVYRVSPEGSEKVLHRFNGNGEFPTANLIDVKGTLYGTTSEGGSGCASTGGCGIVYTVSESGSEKVLHRFAGYPDGAHPSAPLIDVGGILYGTTSSGGTSGSGTIFTITPSGSENVLLSFGGYLGASPKSGLIDIHGKLYGTTEGGGSHGGGTVYRLTKTGDIVVHNFASGSEGKGPVAPLIEVNGTLYGTTGHGGERCGQRGCGTVFSLTP